MISTAPKTTLGAGVRQRGTQLGRYELEEVIGRDAVSTIYRAARRQQGLSRGRSASVVALRVYEWPDREAAVAVADDVVSDAGDAARIAHPAIVPVVDAGIEDGVAFVATPLLRVGLTIADLLRGSDAAPGFARAQAMLAPVAAALDALHRVNHVHGALGPHTIWVDGPDATHAVLDGFGHRAALARSAPEAALDELRYVAPEQVRGQPATPASDQYSLACAMFHLASGTPPFAANTTKQLFGAHLMKRPPPVGDGEQRRVMAIALSKDPDERHQSCRALAEETAHTTVQPVAAAAPPVQDESTQEVFKERQADGRPRRGRNRPWIAVAGVGGVVLAALALATILGRGGTDASAASGPPAASAEDAGANDPAGDAQLTDTVVRVQGVTDLGDELVSALAEAYLRSEGGTDIEQATDGGVATVTGVRRFRGQRVTFEIAAENEDRAFESLEAGDADAVLAARSISKDEEQAYAGQADMTSVGNEHVVALDGIAIVAEQVTDVDSMSVAQLRDIYTCKVDNWSQIGGPDLPITAYAAPEQSVIAEFFAAEVLGDDQLCEDVERPGDDTLPTAVRDQPGAIGYTDLASAGSAPMIALEDASGENVRPTPLTIGTESYPLSQRLYLYTAPDPSSFAVVSFADFVESDAGQQIVEAAGLVGQALDLDTETAVQQDTPPGVRDDAPPAYVEFVGDAPQLPFVIRFMSGTERLDSKAAADVGRLAREMARPERDDDAVILAGFTDGDGSDKVNDALSLDRARVVARRLESLGVEVAEFRGFGKALPLASNRTDDGRARNRRVEVYLR